MAEAQERQRVPVAPLVCPVSDGAPVKAGEWHTVSGCGGDQGDLVAPVNHSARWQPFVHRTVGRAQPTGVPDDDHAAACNHSREGHHPFARAEHGLTHRRRKVDAAVPG